MSPNDRKRQKGGARIQREPQRENAPAREKKPKPRRTRKQQILRVLYIILTVIAGLIVAGFIVFNLISAPPDVTDPDGVRKPVTTTTIDENGNEVEVEIPGLSADRKKQFYTFLLVGQDTYGGGNTDTMMLVAYDVPNQALNVMSLPRDTYVEYGGRKVLLNSVFNRAGAGEEGIEALKEEVGELTGVTPDFHVIIQWEAVGELVDAIGGVEFDVPRRMYYNDLSQHFKIDLQPGPQLLDGNGAMGLLRWRHNSDDSGHILNSGYATGDLGRIDTQQDFMKAVIKKCLQPNVLLPKLTEYIRIFQENVVTNLNVSNMAYFAKSAVGGLDMDSVEFITMPWKDAGDGAHVLPVAGELLEEVNAHFNPYLEDIRLNELKIVTSIGSSSGGKNQGGQTAAPSPTPEPSPTPGVDETPEPSPTDAGGEPVPSPDPNGSPAPSPVPSQQPAPTPAPSATPVPSTAPTPTPAPVVPPTTGPGMEPVD